MEESIYLCSSSFSEPVDLIYIDRLRTLENSPGAVIIGIKERLLFCQKTVNGLTGAFLARP
jgi:hypothetical protein